MWKKNILSREKWVKLGCECVLSWSAEAAEQIANWWRAVEGFNQGSCVI